MTDLLVAFYPWTKTAHVISVIAWMAGLFYLPRLYVYHVEGWERRGVPKDSDMDRLFQRQERLLLRAIMNPAMIATWVFGIALIFVELGDRRPHDRLDLVRLGLLVGPRDLGGARHRRALERAVLAELVELGLLPPGPSVQVLHPVLAVVRGDSVDPGRQLALAAEAADRLEDRDEDLLRHVLRFRSVAQHAEHQPEDPLVVEPHQLVERAGPSPLAQQSVGDAQVQLHH